MNKSEQELKEDEADALADLRQAVKDEVSDEWLLGFVRQYPFRTRSTALNLSHEQLSKIAEDLGLPSAHVVDCVMRQAILAASQPAQGVGLTEVLREAIDYLAAYCGEEGHCQPVIERGTEEEQLQSIDHAAASRAAVPEGWRLVPVEPTDEMIEAGDECWQMTSGNAAGYYRAMLAAAPSPAPVAQEGEALDNK